ncbi:hypothetical protein K440DRAFT_273446 [Wilcoxina mikolae CBS 423.85]|nr:hypothetical protein K440DRAFT_273446 [Wilcoxina mikolae CBS 423.85]
MGFASFRKESFCRIGTKELMCARMCLLCPLARSLIFMVLRVVLLLSTLLLVFLCPKILPPIHASCLK